MRTQKFFIGMIISLGIYFILISPMISLVMTGCGIDYPMWLILVISITSAIAGISITTKFIK